MILRNGEYQKGRRCNGLVAVARLEKVLQTREGLGTHNMDMGTGMTVAGDFLSDK